MSLPPNWEETQLSVLLAGERPDAIVVSHPSAINGKWGVIAIVPLQEFDRIAKELARIRAENEADKP